MTAETWSALYYAVKSPKLRVKRETYFAPTENYCSILHLLMGFELILMLEYTLPPSDIFFVHDTPLHRISLITSANN